MTEAIGNTVSSAKEVKDPDPPKALPNMAGSNRPVLAAP